MDLPDQAFFDNCVEGNLEYVNTILSEHIGHPFDWGRLFMFSFFVGDIEIEVCVLYVYVFLRVFIFLLLKYT